MAIIRCLWTDNRPEYIKYHDEEWGVPIRKNDQKMFEMLALEILRFDFSRLMILQKRQAFQKAFSNFQINKVASFTENDIANLLKDKSIVRNNSKIKAITENARGILRIQQELDSFCDYIWGFSDGKVVQNSWKNIFEVPSSSTLSDTMSSDMEQRGFVKINSTLCYGFMQAVGIVNDHTVDCFRYSEIANLR